MEKNKKKRESLEVQGLGLRESTAVGLGSVSGWRTKIPQATQHSQNSNNNMKKYVYIYVCATESLFCTAETQYCKSTMLQQN